MNNNNFELSRYPVYLQIFSIGFSFLLMVPIILKIIFSEIDLTQIIFFLFYTIALLLINYINCKLSYIYIEKDKFVIENIFKCERVYHLSEYKDVKIFLVYYGILYFTNGQKAYFSIHPSKMSKIFFSIDIRFKDLLKNEINLRYENKTP